MRGQPGRLRIESPCLNTPPTAAGLSFETSPSTSSGDSVDSWAMSEQQAPLDEDVCDAEEEQPNDFGGEFPGDPDYRRGQENDCHQLTRDPGVDKDTSAQQLQEAAAALSTPKLRKRFGPNEDYHLAVQVNKDMPFMAKHGLIRKAWQAVAESLNACPDFCMEAIQGVTAQARFDTLVTKFRAWEKKSAGLSGCAEEETPYIQVMTGLVSKVNDQEHAKATTAVANAGETRAKVQAGDVVRTAALSRIQLGKRRADTNDADSKDGDNPKPLSRPRKQQARVVAEWKTILADMKAERSQSLDEVMQMQQAELKQRQTELEFERTEREKDRKERDMERKARQKEHEEQTKLIASLLQVIQTQVSHTTTN